MSEMFERLKAAIPNAIFHPPATEEQITRVERALETRFPKWLRDLYLCCNGISGHQFKEPYLNVLESPAAVEGNDYSLLGWNQFNRGLCDENRHSFEEDGRLAEWEKSHARNLLIIGSTGATAQEWAIRPDGGTEIVSYDVHNPGKYEVLGKDLVEVVLNYEREAREIHDQLFRGREPIRRDEESMPPSTDIELVFETLIEIQRGSMGIPVSHRAGTPPSGTLDRGTSQRAGDAGMLFILRIAHLEIQIATDDGNLPFVLRTKPRFLDEPVQCTVQNLPDALLCILYLFDIDHQEMFDGESPVMRALVANVERIWRHRGGGPPLAGLEAMAETLFRRDDRRLTEDNKLGA